MKKLEISYNPVASKVIEEAIKKANNSEAGRDVFCLAMQPILYFDENDWSKSCKEVWDHKDPVESKK